MPMYEYPAPDMHSLQPTPKLIHVFAALADLGQEIADREDFEEMVRSTLHVVLGTLGVRRGAIAEYDMDAALLRVVAAWGMGDEAQGASVTFALEPHEVSNVGSASTYVLDGNGDADAPELPALVRRLGAQLKFACREMRVGLLIPLTVHGQLVGAILLSDKATYEPFTAEEREIARTMARHIGVGIHNRRLLREVERRAEETRLLYDNQRVVYRDTVRAFAAAIDCKDKYTQGHSERVGKYSEIIARELGWNEHEVEGMAVAGYLHDIGKLVVERDIINAPYKIDAKQSSELNRHPAAGYEILKPIQHPYADIPLTAKYHHERMDGRGYPEGLRGDQIPPGARIVALADSFDAMTTDRTYKRRKTFPEVIEDLRHSTGTQFAPEVVIAFCHVLSKEVNGETSPLVSRMLGKGYLDPEAAKPLLADLLAELEARDLPVAHRA